VCVHAYVCVYVCVCFSVSVHVCVCLGDVCVCMHIQFNSIQFISQSTNPLQGHKEHMDMEIVKLYKSIYIQCNTVNSQERENSKS
jgi:hypothetical protein